MISTNVSMQSRWIKRMKPFATISNSAGLTFILVGDATRLGVKLANTRRRFGSKHRQAGFRF